MKLRVQRLHLSFAHKLCLLLAAGSRGLPLVGADVHVKLSDLVRILAGSGNLDGTCPVEVEVAQRESQLLDVDAGHSGIVLRHKEVGRQNAALVRTGWSHEEIEFLA